MKKFNKFTFIGGDSRQIYMSGYFRKSGYETEIFHSPDVTINSNADMRESIASSQGIILPLPLTTDGVYLNSSAKMKETIDDIISMMNETHVVFGGLVSKATESRFARKGIKIYDYFKRDDVAIMNAVPTVQGIVKTIIDNVDYTINSSKCAVIGYGKTAGVTADILKSLGADVTVCARKNSDLAKAQTKRLNTCLIKDFHTISHSFDIIINTVPAMILDRKLLETLKQNTLIIDIASSPYGTDFAAAKKLGLNALLCPSLPGKVAPRTAGEIIAKGVFNIIREEFDE